jgi:protein SCO1/2
MSRRFFLPFMILVLGLAGLGVASFMIVSRQQDAQGSAIGGPFQLTSMDGGEITDTDFKGHPFLVFFGYTHCPDICPTELFQISQILKARGNDQQIKALFITVDPERDTPAVMKDYLASFDPRITGVTGDEASIAAAEKAYRVYAKKVPIEGGSYTMDHTAIVYLMNKDGRFVAPFNMKRRPEEAAADLKRYL